MAEYEKTNGSSKKPDTPSLTRPAPRGIRRLHKFVKDNRVIKRSPSVEMIIHLFGLALIVLIMYLDIKAMVSMSASPAGRTRYATFLITLCLPAIIYGVVHFCTRRADLASLCVKSILGIALLSCFLLSYEAIEILWFTPACFAFGYLSLRIKDQWRNRRTGVKLSKINKGEIDEEGDEDAANRHRGFPSRRENTGWFNSYYSYFRMKRN